MHAYMHIYANKNLHIRCITDEYMHKSHARGKYFMYLKVIDNIHYYIKRHILWQKCTNEAIRNNYYA